MADRLKERRVVCAEGRKMKGETRRIPAEGDRRK